MENTSCCRPNFLCGICNRVLTDPQQTLCCGSHFCRSCIDEKCAAGETTCPECKAEKMSYFHDMHFGRLVKESRPQCPADVDCSEHCDHSHRNQHMPDGVRSELKKRDQSTDAACAHMKETYDKHLLQLTNLSSKLSQLQTSISERQEKIEEKLDAQEKVLQALCSKVRTLENRVSSHALLPYTVTVPDIDHYIEGSGGEEWKSPRFYTGTHSDKQYRLQLSVVPHSIHKRNKEAALSASLLVTSGEADQRLTWPFHAMFVLTFVDPSGTEVPYTVTGRHTWTSSSDESSMQFKACITHRDLLKYVQDDNTLHLCIHDHKLDQ